MRYYSPNKKRVFIVGEVVEVTPPTKFSHTYLFLQSMVEPTLVTWELHEVPSGCRVTLTHSGWTEANAKHHRDAAKGWTEILGLLKQQVETGDIPFKYKVMHLRVLEQGNLVLRRKVGRQVINSLNPVPIQQIYHRWVQRFQQPWAEALVSLKSELEGEQSTRRRQQ